MWTTVFEMKAPFSKWNRHRKTWPEYTSANRTHSPRFRNEMGPKRVCYFWL